MTIDGKHWKQTEVHFEWRQRILDETLARLNEALRKAETSKQVAEVTGAVAEWSRAQGRLDQEALAYRHMQAPFPGGPSDD